MSFVYQIQGYQAEYTPDREGFGRDETTLGLELGT